MDTRVKKEELIEVIRTNRDAHHDIYVRAFEGYKAFVIKDLEEKLEQARQGKAFEQWAHFPVPEDHTRDYDRILKMLDMDVRDEIELDEHEVAQYIMDDWAWKRQWQTTNTAYLVQ